MPNHYLWAVGEGLKAYRPGDMIAERYQVHSPRILLDTKPDQQTEVLEEISDRIEAYLKLFPYRLHIPEVYAEISASGNKQTPKMWLLENGPISPDGRSLLPELAREWKEAPAMRQLNWLWQIAQLWEPLRVQGVASSLLNSELLRVEGPILKLLELQQDKKTPSLQQLGKLWQKLLPTARPPIEKLLKQLCQQMIKGEVHNGEQLIDRLDKSLTASARGHDRTIYIATGSESGPTRSNNEDACYPPSGSSIRIEPGREAVAIVCDGIGGQEGGEVASGLAIDTLRKRIQIQQTPLNSHPNALQEKLESCTCAANDAICDRNDREDREGRQRMGTTLVMANAYESEVFITHVGDSRAYLITRSGCNQVTLDDDVATREVRLGYAIYRDAVEQIASGALVQALGITSSTHLHPTVQRFPIDEDCIFLLCSDGLSDKDRVEQYWEAEILPVLLGERDLVAAKERLIKIANTKNGHDNVTIALLYYQVDPKHDSGTPTTISLPPSNNFVQNTTTPAGSGRESLQKTVRSASPSRGRSKAFYLLLLLPLMALLFFIFKPLLWEILGSESNGNVEPSPLPVTPENNAPEEGAFIAIASNAEALSEEIEPLILLDEDRKTPKGVIPPSSIVRVIKISPEREWLQLQICSLASSDRSENTTSKALNHFLLLLQKNSTKIAQTDGQPSPDPQSGTMLEPGERGWIKTSSIPLFTAYNSEFLAPEQLGVCVP
ncbi:MAG: protein phosphatase 2C domain-containing protein [Cyanobacteriota bacterium]|nr:protein phosphatase 2C domain-containing protein [Cyanobacteriota bacterium]